MSPVGQAEKAEPVEVSYSGETFDEWGGAGRDICGSACEEKEAIFVGLG